MNLSMLEILQETIEYYSEDISRRSLVSRTGFYHSIDGKQCAVGRCLKKEFTQLGHKMPGNDFDLLGLIIVNQANSLDELLLSKYQGAPLLFWRDLQNLHDLNVYWDNVGLSDKGKDKAKQITDRINTNYYCA